MTDRTYAKNILASQSTKKVRVDTLEIRFPRIILPEFNTHRVFSRNFQSTRAFPTKKLIADVWSGGFTPTYWGKNKPGMQATEPLTGWRLYAAKAVWVLASKTACAFSWILASLQVHKQIAGRLVEPYSYITGVVTATEWDNFFSLRNHSDAQPEIQALARSIAHARMTAEVQTLRYGEWHLPYITAEDRIRRPLEDLKKISAARCARASYLSLGGDETTITKDLNTFEKLIVSKPAHASPVEHQCTPSSDINHISGNFKGWVQWRKMLNL